MPPLALTAVDTAAEIVARAPPPGADGKRRLLVLSYYFPPEDAIGGMRWAGLTRHLASLGWSVCVLTARRPRPPQTHDGVTVETCAPGRTATERLQRYRRFLRLAPSRQDGANTGTTAAERAGWRSVLRREAVALLWLANEGRGWVWPAARRARALVSQLQPHAVVSTGPPHGTHFAAWFATRGRHVPWFVDMRDPWSWPIADAWRSSPLWRARLAPALMAWQERLWVRAATGVLATTRELANAMAARYPEAPVTWVPNGVDRELLPSRSADPFPGLAIAHVGSLYGGRNLGPVLTALRVLLDRHPTLDGGVRLRTVGIIEPDKAEQLRRDIAALRLDEYVDIRGPVPRPEALALVARSRLAVVLAQDQDCQVPAKLYESIGMGIATLVVAATDSAAGREARRLGAAVAEPGDVSAIVRVLEAAWAHPAPLHPGPPGAVDYRDLAPSVSAILAGESP